MSEVKQEIYGTLSQYHDFLDSVIWRDILNEVNAWLQDARNQLEAVQDFAEMRRFQGISEACRYFLQLPQQIIETFESRSNTDGRTEL
jgi:hypothetical protein